MIAPLRSRKSAITARAPAASRSSSETALRTAASDKTDRSHARCTRRGNAGGGVLDDDTISRIDLKPLGREQKQVGRRFSFGHEIGREQPRLEEPQEIGDFQAQADAIERAEDDATAFGPRIQVSA